MSKTQETALSLPERAKAAIAYDGEQELVTKAAESKHITAITNAAGRDQVHAMRMVLKNARVEIEKRGKAAREDANAFRDAVIEEQKRLIGLIEPEETRLEKLQKEWDDRIEAEKQAKIKAEQDRQAALQKRVEAIRDKVRLGVQARSAAQLSELMNEVDEIVIDESWQTFQDAAADAKAETFAQLEKMLDAAVAREKEEQRLREERAELERLRAEQAERERIARENEAKERERKAVIERHILWLRGNQTFTAMSSPTLIQQNLDEIRRAPIDEERYQEFLQQAIDVRDATLVRLENLYLSAVEYQREQARQAAERQRQQEEQARIDRERQELEARQRREREEKEARERAEREEREEKERKEAAEAMERERLNFKPTPESIVHVLCTTYQRDAATVEGWLREFFGTKAKKVA
jgi:hypothetical protein